MSMTPASSEYFNTVADQWDRLRSGYFTEQVRSSAIQKAYLRHDFVVADVGAGTGFMTSGLAPLVRRVYVIDGSPAMLEVARGNLQDFDNLIFQEADGLTLPLPDDSLDVVFANMYLHHCQDPLAAIREMARVLRPGGRLVITDLEAHSYSWLKDEMADVWQGFSRPQIREWFREADLVNVLVDCTGQTCCAQSQSTDQAATGQPQAEISVFVAAGTRRVSGVRDAVRAGYGAAAQSGGGCCSSGDPSGAQGSCCGGESEMSQLISIEDDLEVSFKPGYSIQELTAAPQEAAEFSLGCGNPTALAGLQTGEVVLDIGSGGGLDAFLSARQVGPGGRVIGVDMTPAMLERARQAAQKAGLPQVEFRQGQAEALPVEAGSVDVVISNCVINLCEDKGQVFSEAYRVLRGGGRLEVSDMVTNGSYPAELAASAIDWPGCVYGALPEQEYLDLISQAGFKEIRVQRSASAGNSFGVSVYSLLVSARKHP